MNDSIYKIAVCDDSQADIDYITILVKEWAKDKTIQIKAYPSAEAFVFAKMMTKNFERITERDIDAICHACCHYDLRKLLPIKPIIVGLGELSSTPLAAYLR